MSASRLAGGMLLAWLLPLAALSAPRAGEEIVFVGCPIMRGTNVPCWLGQSRGELYYLGAQGDLTADFYPPQLGHRMLVEAVVADAPPVCGGIALQSVKVSVLPEPDITCNSILPAQGYSDPPHIRGPGPSGARGGTPPAPPAPRPAPAPFQPPFTVRSYEVRFNADSERLWQPAQSAISEAARYADAAGARSVEVTGYRAAMMLSDGTQYVEADGLEQRRAEAVAVGLRTIGLPQQTRLEVHWRSRAVPARGIAAIDTARVVRIIVRP